ncbi:YitT family protein [Acinetobacter sp. B10A]|uniref:YitT family protein n=1 Tax=Acinetobacter baretiae TaxID=2605383 RepID=UPI001B3C6CAC|nr:YitT family protein [Acinetobacter baretiae]MBF7686378.1 YitT family protein [Acinetobacter baretiae]
MKRLIISYLNLSVKFKFTLLYFIILVEKIDMKKVKHSVFEDIYAFIIGILFIVIGISILKVSNIITGGVAGIALLLSYHSNLGVGLIFSLVNLPFFIMSYFAIGFQFMMKSIVTSICISLTLSFAPHIFTIDIHSYFFGAFMGGTLIGMGALALTRHSFGIGGTGILTIYLNKKYGINVGTSQLMIDGLVMFCALFQFSTVQVMWSAVSTIFMGGMLLVWHKPSLYYGE